MTNSGPKSKVHKPISVKAKPFKRKFDALLRHIKIILVQYRLTMPVNEWRYLVESTKNVILKYPEHFLGEDLPPKDVTKEAIHQVFEGFMSDMHIRKVQAFRNNRQNTPLTER